MGSIVHVIGASGRSGAALCRALLARGDTPVPVVRNAAKWTDTGIAGEPRLADLADAGRLKDALSGAEIIVSCAHARHVPAILAASPAASRFVFLGSTRKFTRYPDAHGNGVLAGEAAFLASGRPGVMLHPTMIYGAQAEDNVQRLAAILRLLPAIPLPGGGRALVQPIYQGDVTASILACIDRGLDGPGSLVIAGPEPLRYADFVAAVAEAAGQRRPRIVPLPAWLLMAGSLVTLLPGLPTIRPAELRRLLEDKAFDIAPMRRLLGVSPLKLAEGLGRSFTPSGQ